MLRPSAGADERRPYRDSGPPRERPGQDHPAEVFAPGEIAAGLRPGFVDGAQLRHRIEGDTGPVAPLVQAAHTIVLHHELLVHVVTRPELDHEVAAAAAAGARGKIRVGGDGT